MAAKKIGAQGASSIGKSAEPVTKFTNCSRSRSVRAPPLPRFADACSIDAARSTGDRRPFSQIPVAISNCDRTVSNIAKARSATTAITVSAVSVSRLWLESTRL
ncbi:hypothetical protein D9M70_567290 [compost metagenome]